MPPPSNARRPTAAWPALLLLAGCQSIFGLQDPVVARDRDAAAAPDAAAPDAPRIPPDATGYHATAVRFETAGNDYMTTGTLASTADSPRGTFSVWLHFNGGDGQQQLVSAAEIVQINGLFGGILRQPDNTIRFLMQACTGVPLLDMSTQHTYTSTSGWIHVLASWDVSAPRAQLYVNDMPDLAAGATVKSGNICYSSPKWGIGGLASGTLDADVADFYAALGTSVDLSVAAERRKFSDAAGKPVDLGAHCMNPTGAIPTGCFVGDVATWNTNKGYGGGFSLDGNGLTAAPTSPSD